MKRLRELLTNREIIRRVLFTLFVLVIFRLLANVPLPGIDMSVYQQQFGDRATSEASFLLSIFTGGLLDNPSIVGLGIGVYITASIIIQLLTSIVPRLEELSKEGARGKQVIDQYTRFLTVPLAMLYSVGYLVLISQQSFGADQDGNPLHLIPRSGDQVAASKILFMAILLTAGSVLIMWLAELITEKGIANGSSVMIMLGILANLPALVRNDFDVFNFSDIAQKLSAQDWEGLRTSQLGLFVAVVLSMVVLIGLIVFMTESTRKLAIQYARRQRAGFVQESHLPLKLNQTGVMPIIFASSFLTMPQLVLPLLQRVVNAESPIARALESVQNSFLFDRTTPAYNLVYLALIFIFAFFYIMIAFKPDQVAENLQKSGGFIPGIRPGKSTEEYITKVLMRLTFVGAIFLGVIALIPVLGGNAILALTGTQFTIFSAIGGTSILIVVGVVLEMMRQIGAHRASQNYEKFVY